MCPLYALNDVPLHTSVCDGVAPTHMHCHALGAAVRGQVIMNRRNIVGWLEMLTQTSSNTVSSFGLIFFHRKKSIQNFRQ